MGKMTLKFMWKYKGPSIANTTLKTENELGGITLTNFKTYYKGTVIKTV